MNLNKNPKRKREREEKRKKEKRPHSFFHEGSGWPSQRFLLVSGLLWTEGGKKIKMKKARGEKGKGEKKGEKRGEGERGTSTQNMKQGGFSGSTRTKSGLFNLKKKKK